MKRSLATTLAAVVASPLLVGSVLGGTPASAAPRNCDNVYPAGQPYSVSVAPAFASIKRGSTVTLYARVSRGGTGCVGYGVRFWGRTGNTYGPKGYSITKATTLGDGIVSRPVTPTRSFRWFVQFRNQASPSALVQVKP